jgi:hypothetical protein
MSKNRGSLILHVKDFLQMYAALDSDFITNVLAKFQPVGDELDDFFDLEGCDSEHRYFDLTFGPVQGLATKPAVAGSSLIDDFLNKSGVRGAGATKKTDFCSNFDKNPNAKNQGSSNVKFSPKAGARKKKVPSASYDTFGFDTKSEEASRDLSDYSSDDSFGDTEFLMRMAGLAASDNDSADEDDTDTERLKSKIDFCEYLLAESLKDTMTADELLREMFK